MAWLLLLVAGALEIVFATSLELNEGFTKLWASVTTVVFGTAAIVVLSRSLQSIPLSTAYAVFTAIGAVGTVAVGIVAFDEPVTTPRLGAIALVVSGIIALRLVSNP